MRILLDSRTLLWWAGYPQRLIPSARNVIAEPANEIYASAVSLWELGLKVSKGKLRLPADFEQALGANRIAPLSLTFRHAAESLRLPSIHGDPFDR
jgi:PIN domain nuclease of toxin-antitoxin system